jgi:hypothetical protein
MSYFQNAAVTYQGATFQLSAEEGTALELGASYWHGPGDPSTWLAVDVFYAARRKAAGAPEAIALELAAQALGITVESLEKSIRWHEEYMRWHDGDPDYSVLS